MKSKCIRRIFWGCVALAVHIFLCYKTMGTYCEYQKTLEGLNTPLEMAELFMTSEYNFRWKSIQKVWVGKEARDDVWVYEILARIISDMDTTYYCFDCREFGNIVWDSYGGHSYEKGTDFIIDGEAQRYISPEAEKGLYLSFSLNGSSNIWGEVTYYGENEELEGYSFDLIEENGVYVVSGGKTEEDLEENTGMTVEEIVEIVEKNRQGFDDIMYGMKAHEMKRNKLFCIGKLILIQALLGVFLVYINRDIVKSKIKGLKKEREQE